MAQTPIADLVGLGFGIKITAVSVKNPMRLKNSHVEKQKERKKVLILSDQSDKTQKEFEL